MLTGFSFANGSDYQEVKATETPILEDGRYFILNDSLSVGLKNVGTSVVGNYLSYDLLSVPFTFTHLGNDTYNISVNDNGVTKYLTRRTEGSGDIIFTDTVGKGTNVWTITSNGGTYHLSTTINGDTRFLDWYSSIKEYFEVRKTTSDEAYHFDINLLHLEEKVEDFVTSIRNIPCTDLVNGPDVNYWNACKTEYQKISELPILNFLKEASFDKKASDTSIDWALSKYNYIVSKYGEDKYENFITNRVIVDKDLSIPFINVNNETGNVSIILVAVVSSLTLLSLLFFTISVKHKVNK